MNKPRTSPPLFAPGDVVGGCRVAQRAGTGAIGEVYLAEHLRLERPVAIKVLLADRVRDSHIERFEKEARLCSRIDHPNVVKIYDIGRERDLHYIIMQYVDGMNLSEIVAEQGGKVSWQHAARIIRSAARGLHAVHEKGLVNRDIKPANIMLSRESRVLLMDFGLVRENSQTDEKRIVGTPAYMSPEQCMGCGADAHSDIFSLGGTLYFLLAGVAPLRRSLARLQQEIRDERWHTPKLSPSIAAPTDLRAAVERAMAQDPDARYPDAKTMAEFLTQVLDQCSEHVEW